MLKVQRSVRQKVVAGAAVAVLLGGASFAAVSATGQGGGRASKHERHSARRLRTRDVAAAATYLDTSPASLASELRTGKSLAQIAAAHGSGKTVRVLVFTRDGNAAEAAKAAGAEYVGFADMIQKCNEGWNDFDVAIATPEAMIEVRKLGKVLGPRGLMPNPKTGTVTDDTAKAVKEVKAGKVEFRVDKTGVIHVPFGKASFDTLKLVENANTLLNAVVKAKPSAAKGKYVQSVTVCSTMGPGVALDVTPYNQKTV